jgi:hypothetical protein
MVLPGQVLDEQPGTQPDHRSLLACRTILEYPSEAPAEQAIKQNRSSKGITNNCRVYYHLPNGTVWSAFLSMPSPSFTVMSDMIQPGTAAFTYKTKQEISYQGKEQ